MGHVKYWKWDLAYAPLFQLLDWELQSEYIEDFSTLFGQPNTYFRSVSVPLSLNARSIADTAVACCYVKADLTDRHPTALHSSFLRQRIVRPRAVTLFQLDLRESGQIG